MRRILFYLIQFTWGLPQNIAGALLAFLYRKNKKEIYHNSLITYHDSDWGGISLGIFILLNDNRSKEWIDKTKVHEYGHTIQSLILGPLYIFIIGIPSIIWCNAKKYVQMRKEKNISYFDFYPEKWANSLGSKTTGEIPPK